MFVSVLNHEKREQVGALLTLLAVETLFSPSLPPSGVGLSESFYVICIYCLWTYALLVHECACMWACL